jgi:glc operon protein GlcG
MATTAVFSLAVDLPLEQARAIVAGALAEGRSQSLAPLTVVVLDAGGQLICMEREDGSGTLRFEIARGKAYGALGLGLGSRTIGARNQGREAFLAALAAASDGRSVPVAGGVLVLDASRRVIGAVGVSGDTSDADEACAIAGIKSASLTPGVDPAAQPE